MARRRQLVLGFGNPRAAEGGFGGVVIDVLRRCPGLAETADLRDAGPDLPALVETFAGYDVVILVGALEGEGRPGEVVELDEPTAMSLGPAAPADRESPPLVALTGFRRLHPEASTRLAVVGWRTDGSGERAAAPVEAVADAVATIADRLAFEGAARPFQTCGACRTPWKTWHHFVVDPRVRLLGLQAVPLLPDVNLLIFEHGCGSSVSILTRRLQPLLPDDARARWPSLRDSAECPGHCRSLADIAACDRHCRNARERELIRLVERVRSEVASALRASGDAAPLTT